MDNWAFGITLTLIGMGGTFLTLGILVVIMGILKRAFPLTHAHNPSEGHKKGGPSK